MSAWSDEAGQIVETAFAAAIDDALWANLTTTRAGVDRMPFRAAVQR